jgi:hypothetical protein
VDEQIVHGFKRGDKVWVEDSEGHRRPGVFVGDKERPNWSRGGPSAHVVHPETKQAEVVPVFRITPRDE